ncbi:hypothetical protein SAMN04487934_107141 [Eubacterium ruminantium]|nr:hypothetical protein SAMN04487934_107141 [Eubacterium ruminantium]
MRMEKLTDNMIRFAENKLGSTEYAGWCLAFIEDVYDKLPERIKERPDSLENLYIAIGIMENYCHTFMHKRLSEEQLIVMRKNVIKTVENVLS